MKNHIYINIGKVLYISLMMTFFGCDNKTEREEASKIIDKLNNVEIKDICLATSVRPGYFSHPEEIDTFKKIIIPAMSSDIDKKQSIVGFAWTKIKLRDGTEYRINFEPDHWQMLVDTNTGIQRGRSFKLGIQANASIWPKLKLLSAYVLEPRSTPPVLPSFLGDSRTKYEEYFKNMAETSSLNKKKLSAFFQDMSDKPSFWELKVKKDKVYIETLGDFLLKKGDDITYDDLLKIIGAAENGNSQAPIHPIWKTSVK